MTCLIKEIMRSIDIFDFDVASSNQYVRPYDKDDNDDDDE